MLATSAFPMPLFSATVEAAAVRAKKLHCRRQVLQSREKSQACLRSRATSGQASKPAIPRGKEREEWSQCLAHRALNNVWRMREHCWWYRQWWVVREPGAHNVKGAGMAARGGKVAEQQQHSPTLHPFSERTSSARSDL